MRGDRPGRTRPARPGSNPEPAGEYEGYQDPFSPANILRLLWTHKGTLAFTTILSLSLFAFHVLNETPLYTATATVVLETNDEKLVDFNNVLPDVSSDDQTMNTELLALRTPELMLRVVDELDLTKDSEFNPQLRESGTWNPMTISRSLLSGLLREPAPQSAPTPEEVREQAAEILSKKVTASIVRDTYAFNISAETQAPRKSAEIANTVAEQYVVAQRQAKFDVIQDATEWLGTRAVELKQEVEAAEADVEEFSANAEAVNEETVAGNTERLKGLRARQAELQDRAAELRERIERLETLWTTRDFRSLASFVADGEIRALAETATHEETSSAQLARLETLLTGQLEQIRAEASRLEGKAEVFTKPIKELTKEVDAQSTDLLKLRQLQREAEAARLIYEQFLTRMKEVSVQQGIQRADSRVLRQAKIPKSPSYPHVTSGIIKGGVLGLVLGLVLVSVRTTLRSTLQTPEELERAAGHSVIGVIPEQRQHDSVSLIESLVAKPGSAMAEAVRNLRTAVRLSNVDAPPQVVMLTSSVPEEGKTILSSALAVTTAMAGKKVLLLEADIRRRKVHEYFQLDVDFGLVSVLSGETTLEAAIIHDDRTSLDILPAEDAKVTPVDLFDSERFRVFLEDMREVYDLVVIDTPPVLAVPDARVIANYADAVVYVVRWDSTTRRMVQTGLGLFNQVNLRVAGLALTRVNSKRMDRYGYYGYGLGSIGKYYTD